MRRGAIRALAALFIVSVSVASCGKKGDPRPPLVLLPIAPADFTVARRASDAIIQFTIPPGNTDGSSPSDVDRVDVYAFDGSPTLPADDMVRRGVKVGSVIVNPAIDPDASQAEVEEAKAKNPPGGLDRGAKATVIEHLAQTTLSPDQPLRSYLAVGVNHRGRRGAPTRAAAVPLGPSPAAPPAPRVTYDEKNVTVEWTAAPAAAGRAAYRVYLGNAAINEKPVEDTRLTDPAAIEWSSERCYALRTVYSVENVTVESEASPPACVTPVDHFAPAAPAGLKTIAGEASVDLIWDPSPEPDLAGYLVLRAIAPQADPEPITPTLVTETTFHDQVPSGSRVVYAVQAVDKAGNRSPLSARAEENVR